MNTSQIDPLQYRQTDYPIELLIIKRWSARAMSGEPLAHAELLRLFDAARWAPSGANRQEWYFLYAHRSTPAFDAFYSLLDEGNQGWCHRAAVLLVILARKQTEEGRNIRTHAFDTGAAFQNLALQATAMGLIVHPMGGFDVTRTRKELNIPEYFEVMAMVAVGQPGEIEDLPAYQQERERPSLRKPLEQIIHEGGFDPA
jgi:nitroreductase